MTKPPTGARLLSRVRSHRAERGALRAPGARRLHPPLCPLRPSFLHVHFLDEQLGVGAWLPHQPISRSLSHRPAVPTTVIVLPWAPASLIKALALSGS